MAIRRNSEIEKKLATAGLETRDDFRKFLLAEWMKESVGEKYRYFVEVLNDGKRVYLERPGRLNKGCDFVIFMEDLFLYKNGNDKPPSHKDLFADLKNKKENLDLEYWQQLIKSIEAAHQMASYEVPLSCVSKINNISIMTLEQIQLLCKWFFIEQDLTYWSGRGRNMLLDAIQSV